MDNWLYIDSRIDICVDKDIKSDAKKAMLKRNCQYSKVAYNKVVIRLYVHPKDRVELTTQVILVSRVLRVHLPAPSAIGHH